MIGQQLKRQVTLKRVIIIAYVLSVLLIAGLTEAAELPAIPVTKVQFDGARQVILVEGYRANPCQRLPAPQVVSVDSRTQKIVMKVVPSAYKNAICAQVISGPYDLVVQVSSLNLEPGLPYELTFVSADE